jgi:hypothetical protein
MGKQHNQTAMLERIHEINTENVPLQTFKKSYAEILAGEDAWIALGNFMHQFFGYYKHLRSELVFEAIEMPETATYDQRRWAAFCAGSVEYLCTKYDIEVPAWVYSPRYVLPTPWYYAIGAHKLQVQEKLRQSTPEPFTRRNVFCGNRTFQNKYEHQSRRQELKTA